MRGAASLICALIGLAIALGSAACPSRVPPARPPATALALGGVSVEQLAAFEAPKGPHVQARAGDWLLETDVLRAIVGGEGVGGALIDLAPKELRLDALTELRPVVLFDGKEQRLTLVSLTAVEIGGRAGLRLEHRGDDGLRIVTEIGAAPGRPWLVAETRIVALPQAHAVRVVLGDRVSWQGGPPFAPGIGAIEEARITDLPWYARAGREISYALAFPTRPARVAFVRNVRDFGEQLVRGLETSSERAKDAVYRRLIVVAPGELSDVAALTWRALETPVGSVRGRLTSMPEWARLIARDAKGRAVVEAGVEKDGKFDLTLPVGFHRLELLTPGGSDFEDVTIAAGRASEARFLVPEPARIAYRVTSKQGTLLSARIVLRGVAPTKDPKLGPVHLASGAGNVAYTRTGSGVLAVPPGRYQVLVTSGVEWTLHESEVDVGENTGATLRAELDHVMPTPGWVACDFHLHAEPSGDSDIPLADRVTSLLAEGIEFAAATDHNHVTDYAPAIRVLDAASAISAVSGIEITTHSWGHFNAFPYPVGAPLPPYADGTPVALFEHVRKVAPAAVVQINHPRMGAIGYFEVGKLDPATAVAAREGFSWMFDTIEVLNGFELGSPDIIQKNIGDWFALLNHGRFYTAVGNSDSHTLVVQWTGYPRTYVQASEPVTGEAIASALKAGRAVVTTGPFIDMRVEGGFLGQRVSARQGRAKVELAVSAPPWMELTTLELFVNGQWAASFASDAKVTSVERLRVTHELAVERDSWVVAIVRGERELTNVLPGTRARPIAFTNPIYVDADGDGNFTPPRASNP